MSIPFKGDIAADRKHRKLSSTMSRTYSTAKHVMHFTSVPIFSFRLKDRLSSSAASFCIYQFDCTCGASYIGRTTRRLSERIREHVPASLSRGQTGSNASAVAPPPKRFRAHGRQRKRVSDSLLSVGGTIPRIEISYPVHGRSHMHPPFPAPLSASKSCTFAD